MPGYRGGGGPRGGGPRGGGPRGGGPRGVGPRGGFGGPRGGFRGPHMPPPPPPRRRMWRRWGMGYGYGPGCMGCLVPLIVAVALLVGGIAAALTFLF